MWCEKNWARKTDMTTNEMLSLLGEVSVWYSESTKELYVALDNIKVVVSSTTFDEAILRLYRYSVGLR